MTDSFWMRTVACVGIAIVLIGDGLILATHTSASDTSSSVASPSASDNSSTADDDSSSDADAQARSATLAAIVPELEAFVEQARGLKFKEPVPVELLSAKDFTAKLREGGDEDDDGDAGDQAAFEGFLRALGLVHGAIDLDAAATAIQEEGIVGFYDPIEKRLYARGAEPTPFVRQVLVHELTHALDDQYFNLDRPELDERSDESSESFRALVEGSAVVVEAKYLGSLSQAEQEQAAEEEGAAGDSASEDIPEVVGRLLSYPYAVGPQLVDALVEAGGEARLQEALVTPPTTSEQTLHPDKFLAGEGAVAVAKPEPASNGEIVDRGVLGEVVVLLMLEEALPRSVARKAAAGWGGDQYVAWAKGDQTCVKWSIVMDTPADTAELVSGLRAWEEKNVRASVQVGDTVVVTNCG